ncbi:MAG: hypothetical protein SW127_14555 [Actinomycetota bacterium]|nr:hypothetical protein [Actinomycetota bacterium]
MAGTIGEISGTIGGTAGTIGEIWGTIGESGQGRAGPQRFCAIVDRCTSVDP